MTSTSLQFSNAIACHDEKEGQFSSIAHTDVVSNLEIH